MKILHKDENGNNLLTVVLNTNNLESTLLESGGILVDNIDINYIQAYNIIAGKPVFSLEKLKAIQVDEIRKQRDFAFVEFDKRYDIAIKDEIDLSILKQERLTLKNAPANAALYFEDIQSIEDVKSTSLVSFL